MWYSQPLHLVITTILLPTSFLKGVNLIEVPEYEAGIEFCEGNAYYKATTKDCPDGVTLGHKKPPACICLKGAYRAYMEDCRIFDGFAKDVCMLPFEELPGHSSRTPNISRVNSIEFLPIDNWEGTHLILEGEGGKWKILTKKGDNETTSITDSRVISFYVINGNSYISKPRNRRDYQMICIEPTNPLISGTRITKVLKVLNAESWTKEKLKLVLRPRNTCWKEGGHFIRLKHEPHFPPLNSQNDECSGTCVRERESRNSGQDSLPPATRAIIWDNEFAERQLKEWIILSQGRTLEPPITANEPNRTMELFQLLVTITSEFCPDRYVPTSWLSWMANMFYLLHKGNEHQFVEVLSEYEYLSTKKILQDCLEKNYRVNLTSVLVNPKPKPSTRKKSCDNRNGLVDAVGYCQNKDPNCRQPVPIDPIREKEVDKIKKLHYVPEVSWNVLDAVQAICFREFEASYRMFHILQQAAEKLFTTRITNLWYYPPSNDNKKRKILISSKNAERKIRNLEICTGAAYHMINSESARNFGDGISPLRRLARPRSNAHIRERRSLNQRMGAQDSKKYPTIGMFTEAYCHFSSPDTCNGKKSS